MIWGGADVIIVEIKYTVNVMHLNYPQTTPPQILGKIVFHKPVPGVKVDDPWSLVYFSFQLLYSSSLVVLYIFCPFVKIF